MQFCLGDKCVWGGRCEGSVMFCGKWKNWDHTTYTIKKNNDNVFLAYKQKYLSKENKRTNVTGLLWQLNRPIKQFYIYKL